MADAKPETKAVRDPANWAVKSSINVKTMGDPRKLAANLEHDGQSAMLGTIVGIVNGVSKRAHPQGGPDMVGLAGAFTAIPADASRVEIRAGTCYLPDQVQMAIIATFEKSHATDKNSTVRFAMEAYVEKGGMAGFTWQWKPLFEQGLAGTVVDPLSELRSAVLAGVKQLPKATAAEKDATANIPAQRDFGKERAVQTGAARK